MNPLLRLEEHTGLTVDQAAQLLACPRPTYYQYRRTGKMPPLVERTVEFVLLLSEEVLDAAIKEKVHGKTA